MKISHILFSIILATSFLMVTVFIFSTTAKKSKQQGFIDAPAYDSGWLNARDQDPQNPTFTHGLGTVDVIVHIAIKDDQIIMIVELT